VFDDARCVARVDPHPGAFTNDFRERTDVLVLYDMLADMADEQKRGNLRNFVDSGKGVVVLHHAICDYNAWPWGYEEVVGGRYLIRPEGGIPASTFKHDERIRVKVVKKHPVTDGLSDFIIQDETYKGMWISPKVQILLTTDQRRSGRVAGAPSQSASSLHSTGPRERGASRPQLSAPGAQCNPMGSEPVDRSFALGARNGRD